MRRLAKELFAYFGLRISRINPMPSKPFGADKYFNTGRLSPLEENSQDLYDRFYADDVARGEYYSGGRLILIDAMARFIRENVPLTGDIIDVGCGTGHLLSAVTAGVNPASVSGCDFSGAGMEFSRKRYPRFTFFVHDIYEPLPGQYDVILCTEVLEHLERPWLGLRTLISSMRLGGCAVLTVPNGRLDRSNEHINFWSPESWRAFIERECTGLQFSTMSLPGADNNAAIIKLAGRGDSVHGA
jgi:2-polyprenyl-3-methyl-5-hydroxy-6-metoxy-1,4-benzoquinol methylase